MGGNGKAWGFVQALLSPRAATQANTGAKLAPFNSGEGGVWQNCPAKTNDALHHATYIIELSMLMYMHTNGLLFASCSKLLNNSTFYHLTSLIALSIEMIRIWGGGGGGGMPSPPHTPLKFRPCLYILYVHISFRIRRCLHLTIKKN